MSFAWPHLLWLLLVPFGYLAWELTHRRKRAGTGFHPKILRVEAGANNVKVTGDSTPLIPGAKPRAWLCAGLALGVIALARPQWGRLEQPVFDQSREILLAIDLSRSMLTPDVKPSRLERAKLLIQSLLEKLAGERVGLLVFSGTAFLQSPLSADYEILREFLPALGPDFLPEGGTNYRALLDAAIDAFGAGTPADRFLIILSDGEATDDEWRARIEDLQKKNITVIGLGVGTEGGGMIPDGSGGFVKDERGAVVLSKLENGTLRELAEATRGVYKDSSTWVDLAALLKETVEAGQRGEFVEKNTIRMVERFQWPLAFGLWCLFVSLCFEFPVQPRPRVIKTRRSAARDEQPARKPAAVAMTLGVLLALGFLGGTPPAVAAGARMSPGAANPAAAAAPDKPAADPSALVKIVGRLSATEKRTARDWAELAGETVIWGTQLKSNQQPVPEGPVRDALAAVDIGSKADPKTADWKKLREELEALLEKPEQPPEQDQNQQNQNQDQQNQDQQQQDQQQQDQQKQSGDQQQQQGQQDQSDQQDQSQQQKEQQQPAGQPEQKPPGERAFGDMNEKQEPPPPPPGDTQKVGGAPERQEPQPEQLDPALALPMQKLEQLRNDDSTAKLFQLMEGEKKPAKKSGKDW